MSKGNTDKKNSDYRGALLKAVKDDNDHPINNGIHMEAHHLVSQEAVKQADMKTFLESSGYEINDLSNLVFLPATLPGACHLEVQLHRGNHIAPNSEQDDDDEDHHPRDYHKTIKRLLRKLKANTLKSCSSDSEDIKRSTEKEMKKLSSRILDDIEEFDIALSPIMHAFKPESSLGCGNCVDVKEHEIDASRCKTDQRDHYNEEHPKFRNGKYLKTIKLTKRQYKLKVGR